MLSAKHGHKYVAVLGSCCTGDAIGSTGFDAVATAKLRLLLFQGRTSFMSMTTRGLLPEEFEYSEEGRSAPKLEWGFRMAVDEVNKNHHRRLAEVIGLTDALIVDHVSAFMFPTLCDGFHARYFLKSWEWERFIRPRIELQQVPFWEVPFEVSVVALRQTLNPLYEEQPNLSLIFHVPEPCFNDGVAFTESIMTSKIDYYKEYCHRIYDEASRYFPRVSAVGPSSARADPCHPNGAHPFRFEKSYLNVVRQEIERILEV
jgi:hypothetical protein